MRGTDANGHDYIVMPRDTQKILDNLSGLSALLAKKEWERAACLSLLVESKGRGRPRAGRKSTDIRYSISEFARLGIYGLRNEETISYYLKAWDMTGLPRPEPGAKVILPNQEFPSMAEVTGRDRHPELEDDDVEQEFDDEEEEEAVPPGPRSRPVPQPPRPGGGRDAPPHGERIDALLAAFNRVSPEDAVKGASLEQVQLFYKTVADWLGDLKDLLEEMQPGPGV